MLKDIFYDLLQRYTTNGALTGILWNELEASYSHQKRHYHTLNHLEALLSELVQTKEFIQDWDTVLFALFYHDAVYNILKSDNEHQSALLAQKRLKELHAPAEMILKCVSMIEATKSHQEDADPDTNLFTDADLSVLGKEWTIYHMYIQQVRDEYSFYPDLLYKPGRKKVLNHFIQMERIYKTDLFYSKYEQQARSNIKQELQELL